MSKASLAVLAFAVACAAVLVRDTPGEAGLNKLALRKLAQVKVACLYENVTDGPPIGPPRPTSHIINLLKQTHTDLVWRGFWAEWYATPESPDDLPVELVDFVAQISKNDPKPLPELIRKRGYSYDQLRRRVAALKRELPELIAIGSFPAQRLTRLARNALTGRILNPDQTWRLALAPEKWNLQRNGKPLTKDDLQRRFAQNRWVTDNSPGDPGKLEVCFPDITNPEFREQGSPQRTARLPEKARRLFQAPQPWTSEVGMKL